MKRWLVVCLILVAPTAAAETSLEIAFMQPFDFVLGAEPLPSDYHDSTSLGVFTHSSCIEDPSGAQSLTDRRYHDWRGFLSDWAFDGTEVRGYAGTSQAADIHLGDLTPTLVWYVATSPTPWFGSASDYTDPVPVVIPNVVMDVQWRLGDDLAIGDSYYDQQPVIAAARTEPATLSPMLSGHPHVTHVSTGDRHAYRFEVGLPLELDVIPAEDGFHLDVALWIENPVCSTNREYIMADLLYWFTAPEMRSRLTFQNEVPVDIDRLEVGLADGRLQIDATYIGALGTKDVAFDRDMPFIIQGPRAATSLSPPLIAPAFSGFGQNDTMDHIHEPPDIDVRQYWDFASDGARGEYKIFATISDRAGTYNVTKVARITIQDTVTLCGADGTCNVHGSQKQSPGPALPVFLALLSLFLLRRR